jgi:hypothetical protein
VKECTRKKRREEKRKRRTEYKIIKVKERKKK